MKAGKQTVQFALGNIIRAKLNGAHLSHILHVGFNLAQMRNALCSYNDGLRAWDLMKGQSWINFRKEVESRYSLRSIPRVLFRRLERIDEWLSDKETRFSIMEYKYKDDRINRLTMSDIGLLTDDAKAIFWSILQMPDIRAELPFAVLPTGVEVATCNWLN